MVNFVMPEPDEYFEKLTLSGQIYETIRDWVNMTYKCNWDREFTKSAANKYLNISNWKLDKAEIYDKSINKDAYYVSQFFKNECPNVYNYIRNTHQCTSKQVYCNFTKELEKFESYVIVDNICKEIWNKFGCKVISLHDSVWCKKSEYDKIENKSLENVKNLPHNAVIFCNDETCYKMYVTDNNGNALPVITSIKNYYSYSYSYNNI